MSVARDSTSSISWEDSSSNEEEPLSSSVIEHTKSSLLDMRWPDTPHISIGIIDALPCASLGNNLNARAFNFTQLTSKKSNELNALLETRKRDSTSSVGSGASVLSAKQMLYTPRGRRMGLEPLPRMTEIPIQCIHYCESSDCESRADQISDMITETSDIPVNSHCAHYGQKEDAQINVVDYRSDDWLDAPGWDDTNGKSPLLGANEIVINETDIEIAYEFPLSNATIAEYRTPAGFTRKQLIEAIIAGYKRIYKEEDESCILVSPEGRHMRRDSPSGEPEGIYGIYGWDIDDLMICGISYHRDLRLVTLSMST